MLAEMPYDPMINRPMRISVPVYGMVHGEKEHGYIAIVEKGASYGELQAHRPGLSPTLISFTTCLFTTRVTFRPPTVRGRG